MYTYIYIICIHIIYIYIYMYVIFFWWGYNGNRTLSEAQPQIQGPGGLNLLSSTWGIPSSPKIEHCVSMFLSWENLMFLSFIYKIVLQDSAYCSMMFYVFYRLEPCCGLYYVVFQLCEASWKWHPSSSIWWESVGMPKSHSSGCQSLSVHERGSWLYI